MSLNVQEKNVCGQELINILIDQLSKFEDNTVTLSKGSIKFFPETWRDEPEYKIVRTTIVIELTNNQGLKTKHRVLIIPDLKTRKTKDSFTSYWEHKLDNCISQGSSPGTKMYYASMFLTHTTPRQNVGKNNTPADLDEAFAWFSFMGDWWLPRDRKTLPTEQAQRFAGFAACFLARIYGVRKEVPNQEVTKIRNIISVLNKYAPKYTYLTDDTAKILVRIEKPGRYVSFKQASFYIAKINGVTKRESV